MSRPGKCNCRESPGLYFARSAKGRCPAILAATADWENALLIEIRKEREIAQDEGLLPRQREAPVFQQVQRLVADLPHCGRQARAYSKLQALGPQAVPAIIVLMDDRRKLCSPHAAVKTGASSFESVALYSPEVVADLLSITLTSLTGESFGSLADGASERVRKRVIDAWRTYLARAAAE